MMCLIINYQMIILWGENVILGNKQSKGINIFENRTAAWRPNCRYRPPHVSFGHQAVTTVGKLVCNTDISRQGNCTSSEIQSMS